MLRIYNYSHEINAAATYSGYTIKPHYLQAIYNQNELRLKVRTYKAILMADINTYKDTYKKGVNLVCK